MRKRRTLRGSAMVVVALTATAVALTAVAGVGLSAAVANNASKREKSQELSYVLEGAREMAVSDLIAGRLSLGDSQTYSIGGNPVTVTATDNGALLSNTAQLSIAGTSDGASIASTSIVALFSRGISNIWSNGLYSNGGFTWPALGPSKVVGSVFFRNSISILGSGQITQDFKTSSTFNPMGLLTIGGAILTGTTAQAFPSTSSSTYTSSATTVLSGDQTLNGYTFPADNALVVVNGNLTLKGTIVRQGTFYVTGTVTINGNVTLQNTAKKLAVISPTAITFNGATSSITAAGYYFSGGTITISDSLTNTGALVGNAYSVTAGFNITWDPWVVQSASNGAALKVPQMWP